MPQPLRLGSMRRAFTPARLVVTLLALIPTLTPAQTSAQPSAAPAAAAATPAHQPPDDPFAKGKAADGATKSAICSSCHGPNGNSVNPVWPRLAGQSAVYITEQLRLFRSGVRDNPVMKPLAAGLSDQDIADLAVYYEAQTPLGLEADPSYWKGGEALYVSGDQAREVPACIACHGPVGRGNLAAGYPALRAQQSVYTVKQLTEYAAGARYTKDASGASNGGANSEIMHTVAGLLTQEEIRNLASYIQGMR